MRLDRSTSPHGRRTRPGGTPQLARTIARAFSAGGLAVLVAAIGFGTGASSAGTAHGQGFTASHSLTLSGAGATGAVTIRVAFGSSGRGTFSASGVVSDGGTALMGRSLVGNRVRLTETLRGSSGTLVIRVEQACGVSRSAWLILRASGAYAGLRGGGSGTGRIRCQDSRRPLRAVYRGTVTTPTSGSIAIPGTYGGWTAQNERVSFAVLADGRRVGKVRIERLIATCQPPLDVVLEPAFLSTYPIAPDGSFFATAAGTTVEGRFSGATATGTVTYSSTATDPYVCRSGDVSWAASTPSPSLPTALPGSYCGSTTQSRGVCLTLTQSGRLRYLRIEARLDCVFQGERARFETEMGFAGAVVPLRSNLSFEVPGSIEGDASGEYVVRGTFDSGGRVSGTLSLYRTSFDDQEGRLYSCRDASFGWQAARVR